MRAENGREDEEDERRYMTMLLEWHGEWAQRVFIGSFAEHNLRKALVSSTCLERNNSWLR